MRGNFLHKAVARHEYLAAQRRRGASAAHLTRRVVANYTIWMIYRYTEFTNAWTAPQISNLKNGVSADRRVLAFAEVQKAQIVFGYSIFYAQ